MTLRFEQPEWLLLILLAVPMGVMALRWMVAMSPARRWTVVAARLLLIALIAGMLAGATSVRRTERVAVIAVIDISGSVMRYADAGVGPDGRPIRVTEAVREFLRRGSAQRGVDDLLGIVVFDGTAAVVASPTRVDVLDRSLDMPSVEGTDIASAIRLAAAMFPPDASKKIVLFSDGNETQGKALEAAREIAGGVGGTSAGMMGGGGMGGWGGGVAIDVVPIPYNLRNEVVVESVDAPPQAPSDATVTVRVVMESTGPARGVLRLTREGEPLDIGDGGESFGRRVTLAGGRHVETIQVPLPSGRVHRFEAIFEPDEVRLVDGTMGFAGDTVLANNRGQAVTLTPGAGSVLVVDGVSNGNPQGAGATLGRTLAQAGLSVETVAPEGLPLDMFSLQGYDLIVLQSVAADAVPFQSHELLAGYVSQFGGGLIMVGGPGSFGAGGWRGTALEPVLPVRLDLPERLIRPSAAIILVIDNSGSMALQVSGSMRSQQDIANEGAAMAVQTLDKTDLVGVITFESWYDVLIPLGPNDDPARTAARIRTIAPSGGTNIPPALEEAYRQIRQVDADVKHVVVLTDGVSIDKELLPGIAQRMRADGITVSGIAVGDQAETQVLSLMAEEGGGTFYRVADPNLLPRIFLSAIRVVRTPMIREAPFTPQMLASGSPVAEGLGEPPQLRGLVLTQPRGDATVNSVMQAGPEEPLLAYWNAGLGRVAAFTSDAHGEWSAGWIPWPGYTRMWTQLAREIARPPADRRAELSTEIVGDELLVRLDAMDDDGRPRDLLTVPGSVYAPDGSKLDVQLLQTGPGVYQASVPAGQSGNYVVLLTPRQGEQQLPPVIGGASRATGAEYRRLRSNITLLAQIAEATGGERYDLRGGAGGQGVDLFDRSRVRPTEARVPLWRTLLAWAIVVLLLDVGTRRIAWDRLVSKRFGAGVRDRAAEAVRDRSEQAARTLSRLAGKAGAAGTAAAGNGEAEGRLSQADAQKIVQEQAERRRAERMAARRAAPPAPKEVTAAAAPPPVAKGPAPASGPQQVAGPNGAGGAGAEGAQEPPASGLLAAKRRAQERFRKEREGG